MEGDGQRRRSLILAGGGTKVAFQAGVLQVWLDEADQEFAHVDAASGGVLNLAMLCQGLRGREIADNWRHYRPLEAIEPALAQWAVLPFARSLFHFGRFRRNVLVTWGLDWETIRSSGFPATFNLYDFTAHEHVVLEPADMDEDRLISAISLPMWFPPVDVDRHTFVDAVFVTDGNLEEAIRRGAEEIWVIWTVSRKGRWRRGFVAQYFQMIEAMANAQLKAVLARIERSNEARRRGQPSEWDRMIVVKVLYAEVPLHYLLNFTRDRVGAAVELGVQAGRRWCHDEGIALSPPAPRLAAQAKRTLGFTEELKGHVGFGASDWFAGARQGRGGGGALSFRLTIEIDDLDHFVVEPGHRARATGWIHADALGGRLAVEQGEFRLFVDQGDPSDKQMRYRLWFRDVVGRPLTLEGHKVVRDDPGRDLWHDTTTLYVEVRAGHRREGEHSDDVEPVARGVLRLSTLAFARQLLTFRAGAPTRFGRLGALVRFGRLFVGGLWDVYGRESG